MTRPRTRPKTVPLRSTSNAPRIAAVSSISAAVRSAPEQGAEPSAELEPSDGAAKTSAPGGAMPAAPPVARTASDEPAADLPFCRYLVRAREERGLSLDDVAHMTKIRRAIIEAVETDARRDLPEKVFVLGYVRSYATAVGMPVDETVRRFHLAWVDEDEAVVPNENVRTGPSLSWVPATLAALVFTGVVWLVLQF